MHAEGGGLRVVALPNAYEQSCSTTLCIGRVSWTWHSPTESCNSVGCISPQDVQVGLVRIGAEIEAA